MILFVTFVVEISFVLLLPFTIPTFTFVSLPGFRFAPHCVPLPPHVRSAVPSRSARPLPLTACHTCLHGCSYTGLVHNASHILPLVTLGSGCCRHVVLLRFHVVDRSFTVLSPFVCLFVLVTCTVLRHHRHLRFTLPHAIPVSRRLRHVWMEFIR